MKKGIPVKVTKYLELLVDGGAHWELECDVSATVHPGCPGRTSGPPEKCYPSEPPEVEYEDVTITHAYRYDLGKKDNKTAEYHMPGGAMKFSIVQFEFLCKLLDNPDFDLADLDWCAYEGAAEYMSEIGKRRRSV